MPFNFIYNLSEILRKNLLIEKWIISPNLRVGFQWIDTITRKGQALLNCRIKTIRTIAIDLASNYLAENGIKLISDLKKKIILEHIYKNLRKRKNRYLAKLKTSSDIIDFLLSSIKEIRLAGLETTDLTASSFEVKEKGEEITFIINEYEKILKLFKYIDYAGVLKKVITWICEGKKILPENLIIIVSSFDLTHSFCPLEKRLWDVLPENLKIKIPSFYSLDILNSAEFNGTKMTNIARLSLFNMQVEDEISRADGSVIIFKASGCADEIREVFRRIVKDKIPFDDVEILYTDSYTYNPLIYELSYMLNENIKDELSISFSDGIPVRYSRPGRALSAWISWVAEDFSQNILRQMIQDGLLKVGEKYENPPAFSYFALLFRQIPIGKFKARYKKALATQIYNVKKSLSNMDMNKTGIEKKQLEYKKNALIALSDFITEFIEHTPCYNSPNEELIAGVKWFMKNAIRLRSELDFYAAKRINREIDELSGYLDDFEELNDFDIWDWLGNLTANISVLGQGPRPGKIYVTSLKTGGHSSRRHTFIVGMDDLRFPKVHGPDPILLDRERARISQHLPQKHDLPEKEKEELAYLFARLSGKLFLSYPSEDAASERQLFPSPVILTAYRKLGVNDAIGSPASYAPLNPKDSINLTEWWISLMCGKQRALDPQIIVSFIYPDLKRGFLASRMRASSRFTVFDGFVPLSGKDLSPYDLKLKNILSAKSLELLGNCPFNFFLSYVLGIEAPPDEQITFDRWLDAATKGTLLHSVFKEFMEEIAMAKDHLLFAKHSQRIHIILEKYIEYYKKIIHPFSEYAFKQDVSFLYKCTDIFLRREEYLCNRYRPEYFEVSVGMQSEGEGGRLDNIEPVVIQIADNKKILAKARLDRIDTIIDSGPQAFAIWDYKTGSSYRYKGDDPFRGGRIVQNIFYTLVAEYLLKKKVSPSATVRQFGYFFPNINEFGRRIYWNDKELEGGTEYLFMLCELMAAGCFPYTDCESDIKWSMYNDAVINPEEAISLVKIKLNRLDNKLLFNMRKLRGYE